MWNFADYATQCVWNSMAKAWLYTQSTINLQWQYVLCPPKKRVNACSLIPYSVPYWIHSIQYSDLYTMPFCSPQTPITIDHYTTKSVPIITCLSTYKPVNLDTRRN